MEGTIRRAASVIRDYVPRGNTLDADAFKQRHGLLRWVLAGHIPALFVFGVWQGYGLSHSALEVVVPLLALGGAWVARNRRVAAFCVTAGLVFCSSLLVHLSGGTIEAHFHFFVLIGLIALYQDWVPFLWNVVFTVLSHGISGAIDPHSMYNHYAAQNKPWTWALIHGVAVAAACIGLVVFWKNTEMEQARNATLAANLAAAQTKAAQRQAVSDLFVNLARRNQSLLDRQLALIGELEQRERAPDALAELFNLDHLATRIRRNAESLLVLSGDDPPRRWGRPVPLGEVVRAAAAEVEDYQRVDIGVSEHLQVAGRAVADLAHLLAELVENATRYSPARADVRVRSYLVPGMRSSYMLSVEDSGVGMPPAELQAANELLADPPEVDLRGRTMGFHVVSRLALRYGLRVSLANTPGGGVTALVILPPDLVSEREAPPLPPPLPATSPARIPPPAPARSADIPVPPAPEHDFAMDGEWPDPPQVDPQAVPGLALVPEVPMSPEPEPELTPEGLERRVPGARLAPALRQRPLAGNGNGNGRGPGHGAGGNGGYGPRHGPGHSPGHGPADFHERRRPAGDPEQMRSMLSRFQASQRAGRAVAGQTSSPTLVEEEEPGR